MSQSYSRTGNAQRGKVVEIRLYRKELFGVPVPPTSDVVLKIIKKADFMRCRYLDKISLIPLTYGSSFLLFISRFVGELPCETGSALPSLTNSLGDLMEYKKRKPSSQPMAVLTVFLLQADSSFRAVQIGITWRSDWISAKLWDRCGPQEKKDIFPFDSPSRLLLAHSIIYYLIF